MMRKFYCSRRAHSSTESRLAYISKMKQARIEKRVLPQVKIGVWLCCAQTGGSHNVNVSCVRCAYEGCAPAKDASCGLELLP